jgi:PKD repeat protein
VVASFIFKCQIYQKMKLKLSFVSLLLAIISYAGYSQCTASYSIINNNNGVVSFSNTSVTSNPSCYYYWYWGDGTMDFSIGTTQVQNHNYSNGIYSVKLVLTDTIGICTNSVITTVTVNTAPCNAIITDIVTGQQQNGYMTFYPVGNGLYNVNYGWNFSDGFNSNGYYTSHTFTNSGIYTATLTASDPLNICNYTFVKTFSVTVAPCSLTPSFTYSVGNNGIVTFQSTSTGTTSTTSFYWNFGDFSGMYGANSSHTYLNSGNYIVQLNVHDSVNFTCTGSTTQLVNLSICVNHISFNLHKDSTQLPSIVWNAYPTYSQNTTSVVWDWGDGTTSSGNMYPSHTYSASGTFSICVSTTVSCGQTDSYCINSNIFRTSESLTGPATINVIPTSVTGIAQTEKEIELIAFPNPIADELTMEVTTTNDNELTFVLVDALGRLVLTGNVNNSKTTINTSNLEKGFYSLSVTNEKGSSLKTIKLVK